MLWRAAADAMFREDFADRVLPVDGDVAVHYADIMVARRGVGNPMEGFDPLIAATAVGVATRDVAGFSGCGLKTLIDPWKA